MSRRFRCVEPGCNEEVEWQPRPGWFAATTPGPVDVDIPPDEAREVFLQCPRYHLHPYPVPTWNPDEM